MSNRAFAVPGRARGLPLANIPGGAVMLIGLADVPAGVPPKVRMMVYEPAMALAVTVTPGGSPVNHPEASTFVRSFSTVSLPSVIVVVCPPSRAEPTPPQEGNLQKGTVFHSDWRR